MTDDLFAWAQQRTPAGPRRAPPPPGAPLRVLLVVPPYRTTDVLVAKLYPLPLAAVQLAAVLRAAGHAVAIKDFLVPAQQHPAPAPAAFAGKHAPPYLHFGVPLAECCSWLTAHADGYDAIGLMAGQCNLFETSEALAAHIRGLGLPLVVGGAFVTTAPDEACRRFVPDVAVTGEGEGVVVEAFRRAVQGVGGTMPGAPATDLNALPLPAWDLVDLAAYPRADGRVRGVLAVSRGCPHACKFCSVHTVHGRRHRRKSAARVREELLQLYHAGATYLCFVDDNLFISAAATRELLGIIAVLRATVAGFKRVKFYVEEGIEVRLAAEPGLLQEVAAAGFTGLALGLETMSADRLQEQAKPYRVEHLQAAIAEAQRAGQVARAFYIIGLPGDTLASVARDLVAFGKLGLAARPNNLKLYPGTDCTQRLLPAGAAYDWRLSSFHTPDLPGLDYVTIKALKTALGAIGFAADRFGVRVFADTMAEACAKITATKGYHATCADGGLIITGSMFRPTPYRHMAELLLLAAGHRGARADEVTKGRVECCPLPGPRTAVQGAIVAAVQGEAHACP